MTAKLMSRRPGGGRGVAACVLVVGGSAGALAPLAELVDLLPTGLRGAVLVAIHRGHNSPSVLHQVLDRHTDYLAAVACDGMRLEGDCMYIAPPDRHLQLRPGRIRLTRGAKVSGQRPAIDVLFKSAARAYGPAAVAVLLSGNLDDGSAGLVAVQAHGGTVIVLDPIDAAFPGMPEAALAVTPVQPVRLANLATAVAAALRNAAAPT